MWAAKGLAILVSGHQPPLLFEMPLVLFPIGLLGLRRRLGGHGERWESAGAVAAWSALGAAVATGMTVTVGRGKATDVLVSSGIAVTALATVVGLVLLGVAARRARVFPGRWRSLAVLLGLCTVPALTVVGGALQAVHERLLELPLVAVAVGWILLGAAIALLPARTPATRSAE